MRIILALVALVLSFAACKEQTTQSPSDPYERWLSYRLHDYTIDQVRSCYCPDGGQLVRLTVRSDTVARAVRVSDGVALSYAEARPYFAVDSLFGIVHNPPGDSLVVKYDAVFGYPEYLDIDPQQHPVDGGVLYTTSNLRVP